MAQTRIAEVVVTLNGKRVIVESDKIRAKIKELKDEMADLARTGRQNTNEYKERSRAITKLQKAEEDIVDVTKRINHYMKNLGDVATTDLRRAYREGIQLRDSFKGSSKELTTINAQLAAIKNQIDKNTGAVNSMTKAQSGFGGSLGTTLKNLVSYAGVFAGFNKVKSLVEGVFQSNLKLSDSLADIRKVAGLSTEAINQLYRNIAQIDSRNTIETLNSLAYTGAKLGIGQNYGVEGLTGFVKAAEQVQMALGEDMGEDALPALAKMTEVMGLIDMYGVEQSMQKAASAIFQLGATSTATGTNIVEFSKRLYGLANVSRVSADDLLALGSAADAMGLMPEVAATAFNKLFTSVQKNHNLIEKTLGLQPGLIKSYYDQGKTMDAIVKIFERMNETGNLNLLGSVFKDLGSDGARLVNVMATMSDRVDILQKHLETSRNAFKEGEAVIGEYMIQNQTAAAMVERASNLWAKAFTNPEGVDMVKQLAQAWYDLSKSMTQNEGMMYSMRMSIQLIALSIETLIKLMPILIQFMMFAGVGLAIRGVIVGFQAMVAAVRAATAAQMSFNAAVRSNALLALVSGVATAIAMFVEYSNAAEEATKRQAEQEAKLKAAFDNSKEAVQNVVKPLETYKKVLDEANLSEKQKIELVKDFRNAYQDYLDYLGIEVKTVDDLRDAYARVVEVMKIKKAYEERESYRTQLNGTTRMDRIGAQAKVEAEARSLGVEGINKEYLEGTQNRSKGRVTTSLGTSGVMLELLKKRYGNNVGLSDKGQVYRIEVIDKNRPVSASNQRITNIDVDVSGLRDAVNEYITSYRSERETNKKVDKMFDTEFTWTDASGKKRKLSEFDMDDYNKKVQEARYKRKGSLDNEAPDKDAIRAARKAAQDEKQALRKELQDAKTESDAIIAKVEEWYRLQETVITNMQADGKLTKEQAEQAVRTLNMAKNQTLADARLAISGRDTESWETTKQNIGQLMLDQGEWSQELLKQILGVSMDAIRKNLQRIDKAGGKYGITTTSLTDAIDKNAAGNLREIARLRAKSQEEVEKLLLEYHYVETAIKGFSDRLAQMGILSETAQQMAQRLSDANNADTLFSMKDYDALLAGNEQAKRDMLQAFISTGAQPYGVNPEDKEQLRAWFMEFVGQFVNNDAAFGGVEYQYQSWAKPFEADFELWMRNSDEYLDKIQAFYFSLMKSEENYYEQRKKAREHDKRQADTRWMAAGWTDQQDREDMEFQAQDSRRKIQGQGQNFGQTYGFADTLADDPEIKRLQNRMMWRQRELEDLQAHNASEELIMQKQNEMLQEAANLAEKVSQEVANRMSKIQTLSEPLNSWGEEVGQMLGEQWQGISREGKLSFGDMARNMGIEYAKLTLKMASENLMKKLQQGLFYKQAEMQAMQHQVQLLNIEQTGAAARAAAQVAAGTTLQGIQSAQNATEIASEGSKASVITMFGISSGAAKTIAQLGWWGIPLIGVITSILMGLLNSAKATAGQESSASSTTPSVKTKLVSGMLTYDEGNVDRYADRGKKHRYIGQDGRIYTAHEEPAPKDGLITRPIATTVQGNPALVAERGPEIVIGRETTRQIMMNEPQLIDYIANYQQLGGSHGLAALRTFDRGTLTPEVTTDNSALSNVATQQSDVLDAATIAALRALPSAMNALQQQLKKPVHINMYGSDGLYEKHKQAANLMKRYEK